MAPSHLASSAPLDSVALMPTICSVVDKSCQLNSTYELPNPRQPAVAMELSVIYFYHFWTRCLLDTSGMPSRYTANEGSRLIIQS